MTAPMKYGPQRWATACGLVLLAATSLALGSRAGHAADLEAAAKDTALADKIAGNDMYYAALLCRPDQGVILHAMPYPKSPAKIFDNLYFLGINYVNAFAIPTSQGIILIDSLDNAAEADKYIIDGLKEAGLNPLDIKYVIVSHGHSDHYGGAHELQAKIPGIHVLMSAADWDFSAKNIDTRPGRDIPPKRDMVISDGQKLTLGGETITLYLTPGHTPGTVSMIIPVTDHGKPHIVSLFGGSSFQYDHKTLAQFRDSLVRFRVIEKDAHSEGRLSTHPNWSNSLQKLEILRDNPTGPNPFLESREVMDRFEKIQDACWQAISDKVP